MSDKKPCRICLRVGVKMYHYYDRLQLKFYYEEIMGLIEVNELDRLPQQFCYECAALLHKYHKFKEKCVYGQNILQNMLDKGSITHEALQNVGYIPNYIKTVPLILEYIGDTNVESTLNTQEETNNLNETTQIEHEQIPKFEIDDDNYLSEHSIPDDVMNREEELFVEEANVCTTENNKIEIEIDEVFEQDIIILSNETNAIEKSIEKTNKSAQKKVKSTGKRKARVKKGRKVKEVSKGRGDGSGTLLVKSNALLSNGKWEICILSEEEAWRVFNAKAEDKKYLAAVIKCTNCRRGFSKQNMLDRHIQLRHIESLGPYDCPFCHVRYRLDCMLKKHMRQHYNRYKCLRCGLQCDLQNTALLHEEYHSGITRKCPYCNENFKHMSTYYSHLRTHRSEHVCTLCGVSFVSELGLRQHKRVKHIIADNEIPDDDEQVNTYCKRCDIRFETRKAYDEHLFHSALHVGDTEGDNQPIVKQPCFEKLVSTRKLLGKREKLKVVSELRNGDDMDKVITKGRVVKNQRRMNRKPTTCHQCGEHFNTQAACLKHHLEKHPRTSFYSSNERYICEICGSCLAPGSVANHQNMHSRETLFTCSTCGRQFNSAISLKRHILTHTGEKPYACSLCDKRFTQSNSMKLHYRTYHLKQPYPKRNRWKKKEDSKQKIPETSTEDDSVDSLPKHNMNKHDDMHFLTLN